MSSLAALQEESRQQSQDDVRFFRNYTYYFELEVPTNKAPATTSNVFIYPLIINPTSYQLSEPFRVSEKLGQDGGLYVEENGLISRNLTIEGHTGFKPRTFQTFRAAGGSTGPAALGVEKPSEPSFSRRLSPTLNPALALSGQRHFHYLQDVVFRTYADLKRDPASARDTRLFFHIPKDQESWEVVPLNFTLERDAADRVLYKYRMELLVVGPATGVRVDFTEDRGLLENLRDVRDSVRKAINLVRSTVQLATSVAAEIRQAIASVDNILDDINGLVSDVENFLDGTTNLIEAPLQFVSSIIQTMENAMAVAQSAQDLGNAVVNLPEAVTQSWRAGIDGLEQLRAQTSAFERPVDSELRDYRNRQNLLSQLNDADLGDAELAGNPTSFDRIEKGETLPFPAEIAASDSDITAGRNVLQFTGAREIVVKRGDTLIGLAAKFLGDARLWQQIAVLNGLRPPFVNDLATTPASVEKAAFPGAIGIGQRILVPSFDRNPRQLPVLPVLGVDPEEPAENQLFGTDLQLKLISASTSRPVFGLNVDEEGGSIDVQTVSGVKNIAQGLLQRILIERGSDILYQTLGLQRVIGFGITPVDIEVVRIRILESLQRDQRIVAVTRIVIEAQGDALIIDLDAQLRGFTQSANIRTSLGS